MKKLTILLLLFVFVFSFSVIGGASAMTDDAYDIAVSYASVFSRRDILSGGEAAAAKGLAQRLTSLGYQVTDPSFRYYGTSESGNGSVAYDYSHVIGYKDNGKEKCLLIGCYYGGFEPTDSYGVGDGASVALSVGVVLYAAERLAALSCAYDVAIAFWGGLEIADDFDVKKCGVDLANVALYINLDCVAAGDREYLYSDDVSRSQDAYFRTIIAEAEADIVAAPTFKKSNSLSMGDGTYSYTHLGLMGVQRFFLNEKIPCVGFLGGNWEYDCGMYRYAGKGEIEGSSLDTIADIDKLNGGEAQTRARLSAVTDVLLRGVTDERLIPTLDKAAKETTGADLDSDLAFYLITFIGVAALIAFFTVLILKQGKDRREAIWTDAVNGHSDQASPYEEMRADAPEQEEEEQDPPTSPRSPDDEDDVFRF